MNLFPHKIKIVVSKLLYLKYVLVRPPALLSDVPVVDNKGQVQERDPLVPEKKGVFCIKINLFLPAERRSKSGESCWGGGY